MKLLLTGDVHVGRASSATPGDRIQQYLAASAWTRTVDLAVRESVAAVLVSGDLVEQSNRFFEARGPIESGVERLTRHGVRTIAVAGNHDHDILHRLADQFKGRNLLFDVLGRNGTWNSVLLEAANESVRIIGWSFPRAEMPETPIEGFPSDLSASVPTIGLVHGDLGAASSRYAPLSESALVSKPVTAWVLGHIHAQRLRQFPDGKWILYPGSPQALDPGETGVHGVWITEVRDQTVHTPTQIPVSTVRYEKHAACVSDCGDADCLREHIYESLEDLARVARKEGGEPLTDLIVDLELSGDTAAVKSLPDVMTELQDGSPLRLEASIEVTVRTIVNKVSAPLPLKGLLEDKGLKGLLARAVYDLENTSAADPALDRFGPEAQSLLRHVLPLARSLQPQATRKLGDAEVRVKPSDMFLREEAIKAARSLLASIMDATGEQTRS